MEWKVIVWLCLLSLWVSFLSVVATLKPKSVTLNLSSKWRDTPLYLEASEFLAEESDEYFWRYIDDISDLGPDEFHSKNPMEQYEHILNITSKFLSPALLSLLKFSLALRAHSPAVEMFHQIANHKHLPKDCDAVIEVSGEFACNISEVERLIETALERPASDIYMVDHHYPGTSSLSTTAVLYAEIGTASFRRLHLLLKEKAEKREIGYVLRHYIKNRSLKKVRLSGYGVELAIKSTEYKAQDDTKVKGDEINDTHVDIQEEVQGFIFNKLREMYPDKAKNLEEFKAYLLDSMKEIPTLKVWELQELSLQAAQRIMKSPAEEALRLMRDIAQNFPTQAKALVHTAVPSEMKLEIERNQQMFLQHHNLGPNDAALFVNGMYFDMEVADVFTLLQTLKQETRLLEGLHAVGVPESKISKILKLDLLDNKQEFAIDIRDSAIQYINDLEHDPQYRGWPGSIQDILRPTYPGMLRHVRKNIYHLILIINPSRSSDKDIVRLAESFYVHKAPVRIGFVFAVNPNMSVSGLQDPGVALLNAFNFISQDKSPYEGLSFITDIYASSDDADITVEEVINIFKGRYPGEDLDLVFGLDSDYDTGRRLAWDFINRTGLGSPPQALLNGVVLKQTHLNAEMFEEVVLTEIMKQTPLIQKSAYKGELTDGDNVLDFLMAQKNVMPRLNQRVLTPGTNYADMTGHVVSEPSLEDYGHLSSTDFTATLASQLKYISKRDNSCTPISVWAVADLETPEGRALVFDAVVHSKASNDVRVAVINNPGKLTPEHNVIGMIVHAALQVLDSAAAKQVLVKVLKEKNALLLQQGTKSLSEILDGDYKELSEHISKDSGEFLQVHSMYVKKVLNLAASVRAVIVNGRVIGPLNREEVFGEDDFNLLERYSMTVFGEKLHSELLKDEAISESPLCSNLMMKTSCVLLANPQTRTRHDIKFYDDKHSALSFPPNEPNKPAHDLLAIVDPASRGAQKLAPILLTLRNVINTNLKIFFNCIDKHSSMPLKSFYRFVIEAEPHFESDGSLSSGPSAQFVGMPQGPLFTLAMATPENWLVESVISPYDLDNIHLQEVASVVHAEFELEHLLLEGHCFEQSTGNPPRGLQFTLGTNNEPVMVDTIVMANLGYFQLKANPGAWLLRLRQGRSADLYDIVSHEGTGSPPGSPEVVVLLSNFRSQVIKIRVNKKPGKQHEELLYDPDDADGSIWGSITSIPIIGGIVDEWRVIWQELSSKFTGEKKSADDEAEDKINIFSLASGHLYERLLRIMMLSVIKNTQTPVKFWFLKNYLSPTFKDFLPYMAKEYGFEYELVQYKWPRWLNQQTEKQRIIWGYKILFLDVLFPLDVKKIIFVDADQVVRADLKELRDLDLEGAPYGYTPFCDSRKEMEGYRFWKSGYWASHLHGRKYHISALYVVDLKKFRRIAAGDRLRGQYQGLSQDPNSLSNLDQDLPNNMIHQVSIKSLPQEWLWCETWCSDESKQYAKTIDLCNNPMTKEPKLTSARRIIPEWTDYDEEVKELLERYERYKVQKNTTAPEEPLATFPDSHKSEAHEEL